MHFLCLAGVTSEGNILIDDSLQVLLDGVWYEISPVPGNWGFNDIAIIIQDGEKQDKTYSLTMYGDFRPGHIAL